MNKSHKKHRQAGVQKCASLVPLTGAIIGYARVSTDDQNLEVQTSALEAAGCHRVFVEKISAVNAKRPQFNLMMKWLEQGDTLLFHSISRLGRDVKQILAILDELSARGVEWRSLTEPHLDASTASGRLMLNITGAMAQFERDQIVDRTKRGMSELKRQGMLLGRKPIISEADAVAMAAMRKNVSVEEIAKRFKVKPSTVYARTNALKRK